MELQKLIPSPDNGKSVASEKPVKVVSKKPEEKLSTSSVKPDEVKPEVKPTNRHLVQSPSSEVTLVKLVKEAPSSPENKRRGKLANFDVDSDTDSDSDDDEERITRWPELSEYLIKKEPESTEDYIRILSRMMGVAEDRLTVSAIVHNLNCFYDIELKIVDCYKKGKKLQSKIVQDLLKTREKLIAELKYTLIPSTDSPKKSKSKS